MTAGRGLEHAEVSPDDFLEKGGPLEILQLWVNLPARLKMVEPRYTGLQREDIPSFHPDEGEATVNLISGTWDVWTGPVDSLTDVHMMTVCDELKPSRAGSGLNTRTSERPGRRTRPSASSARAAPARSSGVRCTMSSSETP